MLPTWARVLLVVVLAVSAWWLRGSTPGGAPVSVPPGRIAPPVVTGAPRTRPNAAKDGERAVAEAFRARRSNLEVEVSGTVTRLLPDDAEGDRHQRFLVELDGGHTLLVAHNIDLAPRVPVKERDRVEVRGEYEWSERGGTLHWTHRTVRGDHEHGWIRHAGRVYE